MLFSDPARGLQATVVVHAGGTVCRESGPVTPHNRDQFNYIDVATGQRLEIGITLHGACPAVFVEIMVDGVFRRLKYYTRDPEAPNPGPPLTDTIKCVWCRSGAGLGWSFMTVADIGSDETSFSSVSSPMAFSTGIGSILVQISIPDGSGSERGRKGRSFEDDHGKTSVYEWGIVWRTFEPAHASYPYFSDGTT